MAFSSFMMNVPKLAQITTLQKKLLGHLIHILMWVKSPFSLLNKAYSLEQPNPSASLVQLPPFLIIKSLKNRLPIMEHTFFINKSGAGERDVDPQCTVCLNKMEERDEMRELCNCGHVFHRECLDAWIEDGHLTCPLCRAQLLPDEGEKLRCLGDPWRMERMIYLFGEDFQFCDG